MFSRNLLQHLLRTIAVGSIIMAALQLVVAARNLETPTSEEAVRLAGLALPLVFLAFLNLIIWTQEYPRRATRLFVHFANGLFLIAAVLVARSLLVTFAILVAGCAAVLSAIAFAFEIHLRRPQVTGTDRLLD